MDTPSIYDPQTMLAAIDTRKAFEATMFLTNMFFPVSLEKVNQPIVAIDVIKGNRKMAVYQSHKISGKPATKNIYITQQLEPPTLCPYYDIDVDDLLKRLPGELPYSSQKTPQERAAEKLGWYTWDLIQLIFRRIEDSASELLCTGKVTFAGEGVDKEIDYQRDADNDETLSGPNLWNATTSDPLGNLEEWCIIISEKSGRRPDICVMGSLAWNAFINHAGVQAQLDNRRIMIGAIAPVPDIQYPKSVTWRGNLNGLDVYTYSEWYIDTSSGLSTPMVPSKCVILGSSEAQNRLYYCLVKTDVENGPVAVPLYPRTWVEKKPSVRYLEIGSSPLLGMQEPDTTFYAEVLT